MIPVAASWAGRPLAACPFAQNTSRAAGFWQSGQNAGKCRRFNARRPDSPSRTRYRAAGGHRRGEKGPGGPATTPAGSRRTWSA